ALWQVLAQQAIGVLVAASLPGTMGVGEVHRYARAQGQGGVVAHLLALIVGQGLAQRLGNAIERLTEAVQRIGGTGAAHLDQHHEAAGALDQGSDRRAVACTLDQVAFPVAGNQPVGDLWRTDVDALHVRDLAAPVGAAAARLAGAAALPQAGDQLLAQLAARQHVDGAVDCFVRHAVSDLVRVGIAQYPRHLLRRPAQSQQPLYRLETNRIIQLARHPRLAATRPGTPLCGLRTIWRSGSMPTALAADRARRAAQRSGNRTQAVSRLQPLLN